MSLRSVFVFRQAGVLPWEPDVWALADISKLSPPQSDGNSLWGTCLAESPQTDPWWGAAYYMGEGRKPQKSVSARRQRGSWAKGNPVPQATQDQARPGYPQKGNHSPTSHRARAERTSEQWTGWWPGTSPFPALSLSFLLVT